MMANAHKQLELVGLYKARNCDLVRLKW